MGMLFRGDLFGNPGTCGLSTTITPTNHSSNHSGQTTVSGVLRLRKTVVCPEWH
jgi:hypothetical protein